MKLPYLLAAAIVSTTLGLSLASAPSASAFDPSTEVLVTGEITYQGTNTKVSDASVKVTCGSFTSGTLTTNGNGAYALSIAKSACPSGSTVEVDAWKGDKSGSDSDTVSRKNPSLDIDIALVNVQLVPEFGVVTGIASAVAGVGALYFARSRQNQ